MDGAGGRGSAVAVLFIRGNVDRVAGDDFFHRFAPRLHPVTPFDDVEQSWAAMGVPVGPPAGFEGQPIVRMRSSVRGWVCMLVQTSLAYGAFTSSVAALLSQACMPHADREGEREKGREGEKIAFFIPHSPSLPFSLSVSPCYTH